MEVETLERFTKESRTIEHGDLENLYNFKPRNRNSKQPRSSQDTPVGDKVKSSIETMADKIMNSKLNADN